VGSGFRTFTAGEVLTASNVQNYLMDQSVMVFGGSAARSSAIGTANFEEGMVSYLTDTDKVEAYNGTNWVSVAPASTQGLTLINTTSFSAVASQSISDVFSATYDNYRIILDVTSNVNTALSMRMRVAGSDNSTSNYNVQYASVDNTTLSAGRIATGTSWNMNGGQGTARCFYGLTLLNPFATQFTGVYMENSLRYDANLLAVGFQALGFAATTSFTGFTLFPVGGASPTITGTVSVYGLAK
jgi:hypothetical protein